MCQEAPSLAARLASRASLAGFTTADTRAATLDARASPATWSPASRTLYRQHNIARARHTHASGGRKERVVLKQHRSLYTTGTHYVKISPVVIVVSEAQTQDSSSSAAFSGEYHASYVVTPLRKLCMPAPVAIPLPNPHTHSRTTSITPPL